MPRSDKSRARWSGESTAWHQLRQALGLGEADWQAFLWHARQGFADFERHHWGNSYGPALTLEDVPETWLTDAEALGHVVVAVLRDGRAALEGPVAQFFLRICDPGPDSVLGPPGIGLAWLHAARLGLPCPLESARLAEMAAQFPGEFFHGATEDDLPALGRLWLEAKGPPEAWDLHVLLAAVDRGRIHARAPFRLFDHLMAADWIPVEVKREFCRGLLDCSPARQRLHDRAAALTAPARAGSVPWHHVPYLWFELEALGLRLMVPGLRRHAVRALVEAVGEPAPSVIEEFLLRPDRDNHYAEMVHQGALDLVRTWAEELGPDRVRNILEKAIREGVALVRQTAYRIGRERFGDDFARPALKDPARLVSGWAAKTLGTKASKPGSRRAAQKGGG